MTLQFALLHVLTGPVQSLHLAISLDLAIFKIVCLSYLCAINHKNVYYKILTKSREFILLIFNS